MSDTLPLSDRVFLDRMAGRQRGCFLHGSSSRHLLRGLLLASDDAIVCGGGDESSLGGDDRGVRPGRKNRSRRALGKSRHRHVHYRSWLMDGYENIPLTIRTETSRKGGGMRFGFMVIIVTLAAVLLVVHSCQNAGLFSK